MTAFAFAFALVLPYFALRIFGEKKTAPLSQRIKSETKPIPKCSQSFRAWYQLHVFACPSDWFIVLLEKKTALTRDSNFLTNSKESIKKKLHIS